MFCYQVVVHFGLHLNSTVNVLAAVNYLCACVRVQCLLEIRCSPVIRTCGIATSLLKCCNSYCNSSAPPSTPRHRLHALVCTFLCCVQPEPLGEVSRGRGFRGGLAPKPLIMDKKVNGYGKGGKGRVIPTKPQNQTLSMPETSPAPRLLLSRWLKK